MYYRRVVASVMPTEYDNLVAPDLSDLDATFVAVDRFRLGHALSHPLPSFNSM